MQWPGISPSVSWHRLRSTEKVEWIELVFGTEAITTVL